MPAMSRSSQAICPAKEDDTGHGHLLALLDRPATCRASPTPVSPGPFAVRASWRCQPDSLAGCRGRPMTRRASSQAVLGWPRPVLHLLVRRRRRATAHDALGEKLCRR